jgi:hypothetical protein
MDSLVVNEYNRDLKQLKLSREIVSAIQVSRNSFSYFKYYDGTLEVSEFPVA